MGAVLGLRLVLCSGWISLPIAVVGQLTWGFLGVCLVCAILILVLTISRWKYIGNLIKQVIIYYLILSDVIEQTIGLILLCRVIVSVFKVVPHQFPYLFPPV